MQGLPTEHRAFLDELELKAIVEYLGERLRAAHGERQLRFDMSNGILRRTRLGHEPITNTELEHLGAVH